MPDVYTCKDCMKKLCEFLRQHVIIITDLKKKEMKLLAKEQQESYGNAKEGYICKEKFENKDKKYRKVRDHCLYAGS